MKLIPFILITILGLGITSCKKDEPITQTQDTPRRMKSSGVFGNKAIECDADFQYSAETKSYYDSMNTVHKQSTYKGNVTFTKILNNQTNVGNVSFGKVVLSTITIQNGLSIGFIEEGSTDSVNKNQFGSITQFKIEGGAGYAPNSVEFYVPKEIFMVPEPYCLKDKVIQKSALPKNILWNKDENGSNKVQVLIEYIG